MNLAPQQFTYFFGSGPQNENWTEGKAELKALLGGKGANLAEMARLGLPVPPGFTITTEVCAHYYSNQKVFPTALKEQVTASLKKLESAMGKVFGSETNPLLVSVRSGARVSMPGMMDTVLNLGLNDKSVVGLAKATDNERFAYDSYRRFIQMYADVVLGIHSSHFESILEEIRSIRNLKRDADLSVPDLKKLIEAFKNQIMQEGKRFPQDPHEQLWGSVAAVCESWMSPRAIHYRKMYSIPSDWGTAVNIQSMVFGNMGEDSGTGVAFTRDPSTGEKRFFGEYLTNAQGEDVVSGIRTPSPINKAQKSHDHMSADLQSLEEWNPKIYAELTQYQTQLEKHYKDMQDIEFTIEKGRLFMLQTRNGKRTTQSAVRIAVEMVNEGLINKDQGILRVDPYGIDQLLHPRIDPKKKGTPIAKGLPASPGAVSGQVCFNSNEAELLKGQGKRVILVRHETSPEDIHGMDASLGILTSLGGMTSHAAVVARGMGKTCVAGCADIHIDYRKKQFSVDKNGKQLIIKEAEIITLDGNSGEIFQGEVPTIVSTLDENFTKIMGWADEVRKLRVRANADTPHDARIARQFGAEGIGLCRTEHMFFEPERIEAVRAMILAESQEERAAALDSIFPYQKQDFIGLFREMKGLPVTIRLLDPPLHEFLPSEGTDLDALASRLKTTKDVILAKAKSLHEINPMLGHRGCRLGISFPEIYEMQSRAIAEAICEAARITNEPVQAEIMIPLVAEVKELQFLKDRIEPLVSQILKAQGLTQQIKIGTMIEVPRAALTADEIAHSADFFSFGTNDLTQTTFGFSRDDISKFLPEYLDEGILKVDPFTSIDKNGVGQLVRIAVEKGRATKPGLKTGACGEHGGDPKSIEFFFEAGLDYVSCSPFRVPAARLAAAQASLRAKGV